MRYVQHIREVRSLYTSQSGNAGMQKFEGDIKIFVKYGVRVWSGLNWLIIGSSWFSHKCLGFEATS